MGAIVGGLLANNPAGIILGGLVGHGTQQATMPTPLEEALRQEFKARGTEVVQINRHGPFRLDVLFAHGTGYWSLTSCAPASTVWDQASLDDWLFGDMVDHQLVPWLRDNAVHLV